MQEAVYDEAMGDIISTQKLTKYYGTSRGIENLDLHVKEGEIFGFIGPNGAGKSTTIRTLLGLIKPTSGTAMLFGKVVSPGNPSLREEIGYLPSEVFYYDNMRVIDLLRYSLYFLIFGLIVQAVLSWVHPYSPVQPMFDALTRPFLRPIRRILPPVANIDLSPLVAILLLQAVLIFL